jgi:acetyl esterase/lipase
MAWPWKIDGMGVVNAAAVGRHVSVTRDIRFADGRRGLLDVYAPRQPGEHDRRGHARPLVVFFYGGGWEDGTKANYRFAAMALAKRGIVTIVPDYRLYPDVRFPDFIADGAKAVRWARRNAAEFGADAELIFLVGHSAGAYIATMLALDKTRLDPESLAALAGVVGLAGPYDFLPLRSDVLKRIFAPAGGDLSTSQPITYARGDAAPMLLVSGLADKTVNSDNSHKLAARITALGGSAATRLYKRADHMVVMGAFSPLLRPLAPSLSDTLAFIQARTDAIRPRPGSPHYFQTSRLA